MSEPSNNTTAHTGSSSADVQARPVWRQYMDLCKMKVVALISFTAIVGMFLATPPGNPLPWMALTFGNLGIFLAASAAAAVNHVVDRHIDTKMERTNRRPVATGAVSSRNALIFAMSLTVLSMLILAILINVFTAILTLLSLVGYAVIYTMYLKRATPQNIVIGGAAGAAPPILGWAAVTGLDPSISNSFWLFLLIYVWTPPHFWALAIYRRHEYAKAKIPMLPVTHGANFTRLHVLLYTVLLFVISVMPFITGMTGLVYLFGAVVLGSGFLYYAIRMNFNDDDKIAIATFVYSIYYLMGMFAFLLIDHYWKFR